MISICDNGKVIASTELKNIFQPFYRVAENSASKGFGLSLSLAERIIKLHKGSVEVSSVVKTGTCFAISLPPAKSVIKN